MINPNKNMKASIVVANYNNAKFVPDCINSINSQTYKNYEIIFFDDNSNDNSIEVVEKFKNVKIIKNKDQSKFGSLNQINAFTKAIEISTGEIIFLLDSDDFFHEKKIEKIIEVFEKEKNKMIIFDFPTVINKNKTSLIKKKSIFKTYWGFIHPTSCISIRKNFTNTLLKSISKKQFTDIWVDLRILIYSKYMLNDYFTINENLTYYRQTENNISSKFNKFSKNWWLRRCQAHDYFLDFAKDNNLGIKKNLDYLVTKTICYFIK